MRPGAAGGLDGADERLRRPTGCELATDYAVSSRDRLRPAPAPRRAVHDLYNQGVNAEAFLYDPSYPPAPKALMMLYKRLREIDVPEMMASIIAETQGKPWGYYRDMTRQLWDEARHAMMGEVGFVALGRRLDARRGSRTTGRIAAQHRVHADRAARACSTSSSRG